MNTIKIATRQERTHYKPGETIEGAVGWELESPPQKLELRLFWFTRGKGTEDVAVVATLPMPNPQREEARPFTFLAPNGPYSFSGRLISVIWALEAVADDGKINARYDLVLSPSGSEIILDPETPASK